MSVSLQTLACLPTTRKAVVPVSDEQTLLYEHLFARFPGPVIVKNVAIVVVRDGVLP